MSDNKIKIGISNKEGQLGFISARGGLRERAGRKSIGATRKVSLTLTDDLWDQIDSYCKEHNLSRSEMMRKVLESYFYN
ncbi:hypothetical protein GCM10010918_30700 [Paenibacillus radicis (ex Gao et al. 2016)]|uniref:Ribbon-helix-helix protein CopG domain-containing protein n=1 Tax=Paenibacillus radicis (ex Gao et al. 2016) TaxID=1737354 RepID=A0A917HAX9_9BACL|nr:hypothetical protein GCM10010918_30700 [Paenibacillus radicis (ex Gao et al. 2016)]